VSTDASPPDEGRQVVYPPGEIPAGPEFDGHSSVPMTMSQFVAYSERVLGLARLALAVPAGNRFCVVVAPAAGRATCRAFETLEEAVSTLRAHHGHDTQVFAFSGVRLGISRGGGYLLTPWGNHPLFVADPTQEADDDGFMGTDPQFSQPPAQGGPAEADDVLPDDEDEDP
jgi:hypothetical protein